MNNEHVIKIDADGNVTCLYSDALPLREMGTLTVERASNVEFDQERDGWIVEFPATGAPFPGPGRPAGYLREDLDGQWVHTTARPFATVFKSREQALAAEVAYLQSRL